MIGKVLGSLLELIWLNFRTFGVSYLRQIVLVITQLLSSKLRGENLFDQIILLCLLHHMSLLIIIELEATLMLLGCRVLHILSNI